MRLLIRLLFRTNIKCLYLFVKNLLLKGPRTLSRWRQRKREGSRFPAFHFISVTDECNLSCQGCWVTKSGSGKRMNPETIDNIINQCRAQSSSFFGILGGEPLMYPGLFQIFRQHRDCYFQLFTNGLLIDRKTAVELRKCGNVTPLISFEGNESAADVRRQGRDIYNRALKGIRLCASEGLITGVAMSVCRSNLDLALDENFLRLIWDSGAAYLWYYIYRPAGVNPCYELALDSDQIRRLRYFMVESRCKHPLVIVDSYWDDRGHPFCPALEGLSHHVNPSGYIEPCPVLQFAADKITPESDLTEMYADSEMLSNMKEQLYGKTRGCVIMEDPSWLASFISGNGYINTSNRMDYINTLKNASALCSHSSAPVIAEKSFFYRLAKKNAFFGLGSYG